MIGRMILAALAVAPAAQAQVFDGLYVGVSVSLENVIGGALVNGVDVLAQERRPAITFFGGYRKEFDNGFVVGLETGFAFEDGDLQFRDSASGLAIDYFNNTHWRYGAIAGFRTGDDTLLFAYLNETKRDFDVTGSGPLGSFTQQDGQGLLGYGLGVEYGGWDAVHLRATLGSSRADFGSRVTSMKPDRPLEGSISLLRQF